MYYIMIEYKPIILLSLTMLLLDYIMLSNLKPLWRTTIQKVQKTPFAPNITYALFSYILLIFGVYYFVYRHINKSTWKYDTLVKGFLFGFVLYGVFDFTNLVIFKEYSLKTAIIDMIWGGILMSIVSFNTYYFSEIL